MASGAEIILVTPGKVELEYAIKLDFKATNNEAKYEALVNGMKIAKELGVKQIVIKSDS